MVKKLIEAIEAQNLAEAKRLIATMDITELSKVTDFGSTVLIFAAHHRQEKICEMLIPKMSEKAINHVVSNGETALSIAARCGYGKVCELLILKLPIETINYRSSDGYTAHSLALYYGYKNIYDLLPHTHSELLQKRKNYEEQQQIYNQQLISSIKENKIETAKSIIPFINPTYSNSVDKNNNTALHYAVDKNLEELSISLINIMSSETISIGNIYL